MNEKDTLRQYIEVQLASGVSAGSVRQQLVGVGWDPAMVDDVFNGLNQPSEVGTTVQPSPQPLQQLTHDYSLQSQASEKYGTVDAVKDAYRALRANIVAVGVSLVVGFAFVLGIVILAVFVGVALVFAAAGSFANESAGLGWMVLVFLLLFGVFTVVNALVSAFVQSIVGLAINDGADGTKSNLKMLVFTAIKRSPRVLLAIIICSLAAMAPIALALVLTLILSAISSSLAFIGYLLAIVAIISVPILLMRLILTPVVALLEAEVPISGLIGRSRQLMRDGGSIFMLKLFGLAVLVSILISIITPSESELEEASTLTTYVVSAIGIVFYLAVSAVLIVFYRNRRAVKG